MQGWYTVEGIPGLSDCVVFLSFLLLAVVELVFKAGLVTVYSFRQSHSGQAFTHESLP